MCFIFHSLLQLCAVALEAPKGLLLCNRWQCAVDDDLLYQLATHLVAVTKQRDAHKAIVLDIVSADCFHLTVVHHRVTCFYGADLYVFDCVFHFLSPVRRFVVVDGSTIRPKKARGLMA